MRRWLTLALVLVSGGRSWTQALAYDFESGYQGWIADFADYGLADSVRMELQHAHQAMPEITPPQKGLRLFGHNYSDDLFLFIKRRVTGLVPNAVYSVVFSVDVVTNMPPDGIGGADLTLKAGATPVEPRKVASGGMYRMNIDKGNQSRPGPDMDTLGHVNHQVPGAFRHHLVRFPRQARPFRVTANAQGEAWLIVGAESAFEVQAPFYVAAVSAVFTAGTAIGPPRAGRRTPRALGARPGAAGWLVDAAGRKARLPP